jgi:hypothetical protein
MLARPREVDGHLALEAERAGLRVRERRGELRRRPAYAALASTRPYATSDTFTSVAASRTSAIGAAAVPVTLTLPSSRPAHAGPFASAHSAFRSTASSVTIRGGRAFRERQVPAHGHTLRTRDERDAVERDRSRRCARSRVPRAAMAGPAGGTRRRSRRFTSVRSAFRSIAADARCRVPSSAFADSATSARSAPRLPLPVDLAGHGVRRARAAARAGRRQVDRAAGPSRRRGRAGSATMRASSAE